MQLLLQLFLLLLLLLLQLQNYIVQLSESLFVAVCVVLLVGYRLQATIATDRSRQSPQ